MSQIRIIIDTLNSVMEVYVLSVYFKMFMDKKDKHSVYICFLFFLS